MGRKFSSTSVILLMTILGGAEHPHFINTEKNNKKKE